MDLESLLLPIRLGPLPGGTVIVAKEVAVVTVPADRRRGKAPGPGISVRRASAYLPGKDCWANVTKWGTKYAYLQEGYTVRPECHFEAGETVVAQPPDGAYLQLRYSPRLESRVCGWIPVGSRLHVIVSPSTGDGEYTEEELAHDHPRYEGIRNAVTGFARTCYLERETPGAEASGLGGAVSVSEAVPRKEPCAPFESRTYAALLSDLVAEWCPAFESRLGWLLEEDELYHAALKRYVLPHGGEHLLPLIVGMY